jgi:diaminopimelate decarboxylase
MDHFSYRDGQLHCENVPLAQIAEQSGTPAYIYSRATLEWHYRELARAFADLRPRILYSVKSCGNVNLLRILAECGSGMDVVSGGELHRALLAGTDPGKIVFAGVGKSDAELEQAIRARIGFVNVESAAELEQVERTARRLGIVPSIALRINPDVIDEKTHKKTTTGNKGSKFGIDLEEIEALYDRYGKSSTLSLRGLHFHLGSPIYSAEPYVRAAERVFALIGSLRAKGYRVDALDIGGGFMADYGYRDTHVPSFEQYAGPIVEAFKEFVAGGGLVMMEPGRTISANAGLLLTKVLYLKRSGDKNIAVVDTGMHHLIRPALYESVHFIWPVQVREAHVPKSRDTQVESEGLVSYDIVGPICESTDRLASARRLPELKRGDLLAIFTAGAYGMVMASQYNAVPRPPEILVEGSRVRTIRRRETYDDLVAAEVDL